MPSSFARFLCLLLASVLFAMVVQVQLDAFSKVTAATHDNLHAVPQGQKTDRRARNLMVLSLVQARAEEVTTEWFWFGVMIAICITMVAVSWTTSGIRSAIAVPGAEEICLMLAAKMFKRMHMQRE